MKRLSYRWSPPLKLLLYTRIAYDCFDMTRTDYLPVKKIFCSNCFWQSIYIVIYMNYFKGFLAWNHFLKFRGVLHPMNQDWIRLEFLYFYIKWKASCCFRGIIFGRYPGRGFTSFCSPTCSCKRLSINPELLKGEATSTIGSHITLNPWV